MLNMNRLSITNTLFATILLALIGLAGCNSEQQSADRHVIPVQINVEEKVVFVNNFVNLTDNQDLNIFEEGLADMLEDTLINIRNIKIVTRHSMKTFLAVSDDESDLTITEAARKKGVEYIIDGWISTTDKGTYKAFANLINLEGEKEEIHSRFAVVEFASRDNALEKINELVEEVASKISRNREELENLVDYEDFDYEFFQRFHSAISSAYRGRPDVTISIMESTLAEYLQKLESTGDEKQRQAIRNMTFYARFLLAQIYTDIGDPENSLTHIEKMELSDEERNRMGLRNVLLEAIRNENTGHYAQAAEQYKTLIEKWPYETFFHLRLAEMTLQIKGNSEEALAVVKEGLKLLPDSSLLNKKAATLRIHQDGERVIEEFAAENVDNERSAVTTEVVSSLINKNLEEGMLRDNPYLLPLVVNVKPGKDGTFTYVGNLKVNTENLENAIDYSCPDTTASVVKMANFAVRSGNIKFAYKVAENIFEHGTAPNSKDAYHTIFALAKTAEGSFDEAKKHAVMISVDQPERYLVIGNLFLHRGEHEKAVKYMEKALSFDNDPHPLIYYNIANAHLLAGHYKEWSKYNEKFLEASVQLGLIPESLKNKILALPRAKAVVRGSED